MTLAVVGFWGCTTAQDLPGIAANGGSAGHAGNAGGATHEGGARPDDPTGGVAGHDDPAGGGATSEGGAVPIDGGSGGASAAGDGGGAGGEATSCSVNVEVKPVMPTVLLLVDNSSSMFNPRAKWDMLYNVLMRPTDGVVASLQNKVRFGFTSYRGSSMAGDPACPSLFEVGYALGNFAAIDSLYKKQTAEYFDGAKWETPTGAAIKKTAEKLAALVVDPPGPKYILLVTDGSSNTCGAIDPQCGSDESIKAVQDAKVMGIGTLVVGVGDVSGDDVACESAWGRCGELHLQDLANAGQGLPVHAPPDQLKYQACTPTQMLAATYAGANVTPGSAPYYTATTVAELDAAMSSVLSPVVSCTYDLNVTVVGEPARGVVRVEGVARTYGDANGWSLDASKSRVTLQGAACGALKEANATLSVGFPCGVAISR